MTSIFFLKGCFIPTFCKFISLFIIMCIISDKLEFTGTLLTFAWDITSSTALFFAEYLLFLVENHALLYLSLLNCAPWVPSRLRALPIINTRLRALPIINTCLRAYTLYAPYAPWSCLVLCCCDWKVKYVLRIRSTEPFTFPFLYFTI